MTDYKRPYSEPEPRTFDQWCFDLGLTSNRIDRSDRYLSYDEFCGSSDTEFRKIGSGPIYGWWREHGDKWGESRTVREWIADFDWSIEELEPEDEKDLNLFIGHDQFWNWSSGKFTMKPATIPRLLDFIKGLLR